VEGLKWTPLGTFGFGRTVSLLGDLKCALKVAYGGGVARAARGPVLSGEVPGASVSKRRVHLPGRAFRDENPAQVDREDPVGGGERVAYG